MKVGIPLLLCTALTSFQHLVPIYDCRDYDFIATCAFPPTDAPRFYQDPGVDNIVVIAHTVNSFFPEQAKAKAKDEQAKGKGKGKEREKVPEPSTSNAKDPKELHFNTNVLWMAVIKTYSD